MLVIWNIVTALLHLQCTNSVGNAISTAHKIMNTQPTPTAYRAKSHPNSAKAIRMQNEPTAVYRQKLTSRFVEESPMLNIGSIVSSHDAFKAAWAFWDLEEIGLIEHAYALYVNRSNAPIAWALISTGSMAGCDMDPKIIMSHALLSGAHGLVIYHNHPSGDLTPSQADYVVTNNIKQAGKVLDISLLDHIILAPNGTFHSFADHGRL